jgi:hypothetical protein
MVTRSPFALSDSGLRLDSAMDADHFSNHLVGKISVLFALSTAWLKTRLARARIFLRIGSSFNREP